MICNRCGIDKPEDSFHWANGSTLIGYKGGEFVMDNDTPVWKAEYGDCGDAILGLHYDKRSRGVVIVAADIGDYLFP